LTPLTFKSVSTRSRQDTFGYTNSPTINSSRSRPTISGEQDFNATQKTTEELEE
jgi:hypothetical protein